MADMPRTGDWLVVEDLLERGDPAFVDELRLVSDADRLGAFAGKWFADRRTASRKLLLDYLSLPFNAYRHEALVKRLFKLAEKAGDDEVMGRFLVQFDLSLRRIRRKRFRGEWTRTTSRAEADRIIRQWTEAGAYTANEVESQGTFTLTAAFSDEVAVVPQHTTMPREKLANSLSSSDWRSIPSPDRSRQKELHNHPVVRRRLETFRLFSVQTRQYLRRRAWRYFRNLGRKHPERYIPAVCKLLMLYQDRDVADGLALLDNWGLGHILFQHHAAIEPKSRGWTLAPGHALSELDPAPAFEEQWKKNPRQLLDLLKRAQCRPVRQWALRLLRKQGQALDKLLPIEEWLDWLTHPDPDVVSLAADILRKSSELEKLSAERWLKLVDGAGPESLDLICELMATHIRPEKISLAQALDLAMRRPLPVARLGLRLLKTLQPSDEEQCRSILGLAEAQSDAVRGELIRWARGVLGASPFFQPDWIVEFLDSRQQDVRAEGWTWFMEEPRTKNAFDTWQKLLETPYDDVRLRLVGFLEGHAAGTKRNDIDRAALDDSLLRFLWSSVLLNIHRGGRKKPLVVGQVVERIERRPGEASKLLPLLSVALRSVRGPEWRAGLAGVVRLLDRHPDMEALIRREFPELTW